MTEKELLIEEAKPSEAAAIEIFLKEVISETDFIVMPDIDFSTSLLHDSLACSFDRYNSICLVAKLDNELIGLLNVSSSDELAVNHIGDVFIVVKKQYWGNGIGHYLFELMCDWAEHNEMIKRLELTVQSRNQKAIQLYKDFGFEIEGIKRAAIQISSECYLDVMMMSKMIGI